MLFKSVLPTINLMGIKNFSFWILSLFLFTAQTVFAQTPMQAGLYRIESNQDDVASVNPPIPTINDVKSYGSYSFDISESLIDFGKIIPTNPLERKNNINIDSTDTSYYLKAYENHPLLSPASGTIPDTTCDNGSCSEQISSIWKNILAFGLGFNCQGDQNNCGNQFPTLDSFMQFADQSRSEDYNTLLSDVYGKNSLELTYKLNISTQQKPGAYSNSLTILTLPSY